MKYMFLRAALFAAVLGAMSAPAFALPATSTPVYRTPGRCGYLMQIRQFQSAVGCYLMDNSNKVISYKIAYEFNGQTLNYRQWSPEARQELGLAFERTILWYESGMNNYPGPLVQDPPPNLLAADFAAGTRALTAFDPSTVLWPLYVGRVALILAAEINSWVPWSIKTFEAMPNGLTQLELLFRTQQVGKAYYDAGGNLVVLGTGYLDSITPTNSITIFKFLKEKGLIGNTPRQTIERVLNWSRWNQAHTFGPLSGKHLYHYFQHWGDPPMSRMLEGTYSTDNLPTEMIINKHNWTHGCYGTSDFLVRLLKAANIPADTTLAGSHRSVNFITEAMYLSHADDTYTSFFRYNRPAGDLLIDKATFDAWFPVGNYEISNNNVGRQVMEININYPSPQLLDIYKQDLTDGKTHASGNVYQYYKTWYTVAELEAKGLWQKMDATLGWW